MKFPLKTKALVCGASQGIGEAVALKLAENGVTVTLVSRTESKLKAVKEKLEGEDHNFFTADFTKAEDVKKLTDFLKENGPYQILINNSGGPAAGALINAEDEGFKEAFQAHILSSQMLIKEMTPMMENSGWGRIVNIISTSVRIPIPNLGVSNTIRGAVASWSKTLSLELGSKNITVNNVLPGYTKTPRLEKLISSAGDRLSKSREDIENLWKAKVPMARFGEASEVANAVCFLASEEASYINGVNLQVDGGRTGSI